MGIEIVFLIKAVFFGLAAVILIPKELYKKFLVYGLFLGAIGEWLFILVFDILLGAFRYQNMGVFNVLNITSFWTPIAWMFVVMFFLYALPTRKFYFYLYVLTFGIFGYCMAIVLQNFGLYRLIGVYKYFSPFVFSGWFYILAQLYMKAENISLQ